MYNGNCRGTTYACVIPRMYSCVYIPCHTCYMTCHACTLQCTMPCSRGTVYGHVPVAVHLHALLHVPPGMPHVVRLLCPQRATTCTCILHVKVHLHVRVRVHSRYAMVRALHEQAMCDARTFDSQYRTIHGTLRVHYDVPWRAFQCALRGAACGMLSVPAAYHNLRRPL